MNPSRIPFARVLFDQWRRVRGDLTAPGQRPFSRSWESLLEAAGLLSAVERNEAEGDARVLAAEAWLELKPVPGRPHFLQRVVIPLAAERRWLDDFGYVPPDDAEARRIAAHPWQAPLAFVPGARIGIALEDLLKLDAFFAEDSASRPVVPVKERSLGIFGDEKRLDALLPSALFREGRLTLDHLRCRIVPEPLGWRRGLAPSGPVIVLENAATWDTYSRLDSDTPTFAAVVYGGGFRFVEGVAFLADIFVELGGQRPVLYFGDLDAAGLRIPAIASENAVARGLPSVDPHLPSYRALIDTAAQQPPTPTEDEAVSRESCAWLGPLADKAWRVLSSGGRLAQERLGLERGLFHLLPAYAERLGVR